MKKLILDYSKWRCGGEENFFKSAPNKLGEGKTLLLNSEGYLCCLGQFSLQLDSDLTEEDIKGKDMPGATHKEIPLLSYISDDEENRPVLLDSEITEEAVAINDDKATTPDEKILKLKNLFSQEEYEIEVINKP